MDLDDEELEATRILNGVGKTRDTNIGLEKAKKILNESIIQGKYYIFNTELKKIIKVVLQALEDKDKEIKKLSIVRNEIDYGYEYTYLIPKDRIVTIEKNKYLIEIEDGKFVDIKELDETINDKKEMINKYIEILNKHKERSKYFISNNKLEKIPDGVRAVSEYIMPDTVIQMLEDIKKGL